MVTKTRPSMADKEETNSRMVKEIECSGLGNHLNSYSFVYDT